MMVIIRDDTWNVINMQHITPNSKRWDYSDIFGGGHKKIKGPIHMVEGGHHLRKATNPYHSDFKSVFSEHMLCIKSLTTFYEITLRGMTWNIFNDKSTLVQVKDWCHLARSHYLSWCWAKYISPYAMFTIMPSHQQNMHVFAVGRKNMNDIFNFHVYSVSHMPPGLPFSKCLAQALHMASLCHNEFRQYIEKTCKCFLHVLVLCVGKIPVTSRFPSLKTKQEKPSQVDLWLLIISCWPGKAFKTNCWV